MGLHDLFHKIHSKAEPQLEHKEEATVPASNIDAKLEKNISDIDDSPVPLVTWRVAFLAVVASMGGFIFGYSTGMQSPLLLLFVIIWMSFVSSNSFFSSNFRFH